MAFCENCGKELSPGSAFCEQCGTKLDARLFRESASGKRKKQTRIQAVYCEECGAKLVPGAFYCEECGTPVPVTEEIPEKRNWDSLSPKDLNYGLFWSSEWVSKWEKAVGNADGNEVGIILTNLSELASRLGVSESEVEGVIIRYIASTEKRGVNYYPLYLDKNSVWPENCISDDVVCIVDFLRQVIDVARPKYLFILGDETVVDVANWDNEGGTDELGVFSDFAYSVLDTTSPWEGQEFNLTEALRVGRLPVSKDDFEGFRLYFENAEKGIGSLKTLRSFGLSAQVWEEESQYEYEQFRSDSRDVETSPDADIWSVSDILMWSEDYNILFFNLHGSSSKEKNYWAGEGRINGERLFVKAVSPDVFGEYDVPFFLGVEACYGARYIGYTLEESILKTSMRNRCLAFLGSSITAMGSSVPDLRCCADIVIGDFMKHVARGETAGDAHILAVDALIRQSKSNKKGYLSADDILTIAEFSLYGDPSACTGKNKNSGKIKGLFKKTIGGVPKGIRVPVPDVLHAAKMYLAEVNSRIEAEVDAYAMQFLPFQLGDMQQEKSVGFSQKICQTQNGELFNKTYSFDTELGKSFVSIYFDKNGKIIETLESK